MVKHILMVCTGNTCRSPMAEGYLNTVILQKGLPMQVKSAGMGEDNQPASDHAIEAMKEIGIDISNHRSHHMTPAMVAWADLIVCMTRSHRDIMVNMLHIPEEKIMVLGAGVPDPYGGDLEIYRQTRDALIELTKPLIPSISIFDMTESYVPIVTELHELCMPDPWTENGFRAELTKDTSVFRIAEDDDGNILGFYGIYIVLETAEIAQIAVAPDVRRQKVGSWLIEDMISIAKSRGAEKLQLEVRKENEGARKLYESFGFLQDGCRKNFYANPSDDAILYSLSLKEESK